MNISRFLRNFRYHYKKYLAMFFALIAMTFTLGDLVVSLCSMFQNTHAISFNTIWDIFIYLILIYIFFSIFRGNKDSSVESLRGALMFTWFVVINQIFSLIYGIVFNTALGLNGYWANADYLSFSFLLIDYFILGIEIAVGIMAYISLRQYTSGRDVSSRKVKILFALFFSMVILGFAPQIYFFIRSISYSNVWSILIFLFSFYELFGSIACILTVLRLPR